MVLIFDAAEWYTDNSALPRYCADPAETVARVREILAGPGPAADESRRPYVVAAKLIFMVPRQEAEALPAYLARLRGRISETCGEAYR